MAGMTKVVRAFSIDPHVSEALDQRVKKRRRSEYVNEALDWYLNKNLGEYQKEVIESRNFLIAEINKKRLIIGGLEDEIEDYKDHIEEIIDEVRVPSVCRCLWCRLKKRLQRSREE
jgi:hypothetical protein